MLHAVAPFVSALAEMYEIYSQTLRLYEREGLLNPTVPYTIFLENGV